jgi:tRNA dimethylallyltransferase
MNHIVLIGPTGIGKSARALKLAHELKAEIVSVDSMQIYRGMDIGTAKLTTAEQEGIVHHLIDIVDPDERFTVADFVEAVKKIIKAAQQRNVPLVFCGGTGFYFNALLRGLAFVPVDNDPEVRARLTAELDSYGSMHLWQRLLVIDPVSAARVHSNDSFRLIRALEVYELTGRPMSTQVSVEPSVLGADYQLLGLTMPREQLYARLNERVDTMLAKGLVREVQRLLEKGYSRTLTALQAIGYKEIVAYLAGECTLDKALEDIKQGTRNYAKRQYTWFRRFENVVWEEVC